MKGAKIFMDGGGAYACNGTMVFRDTNVTHMMVVLTRVTAQR